MWITPDMSSSLYCHKLQPSIQCADFYPVNFVDILDLKACPRPTEMEFESNLSSKYHSIWVEYIFLTAENLRIRPSEFECEAGFSSLSQ